MLRLEPAWQLDGGRGSQTSKCIFSLRALQMLHASEPFCYTRVDPKVREIFNQLPPLVTEGNKEPGDEYETAKAQLTAYFEPQKNRRYEVYRFRQTTQAASETLDSTTRDYVLWLKHVNFKT